MVCGVWCVVCCVLWREEREKGWRWRWSGGVVVVWWCGGVVGGVGVGVGVRGGGGWRVEGGGEQEGKWVEEEEKVGRRAVGGWMGREGQGEGEEVGHGGGREERGEEPRGVSGEAEKGGSVRACVRSEIPACFTPVQ